MMNKKTFVTIIIGLSFMSACSNVSNPIAQPNKNTNLVTKASTSQSSSATETNDAETKDDVSTSTNTTDSETNDDGAAAVSK